MSYSNFYNRLERLWSVLGLPEEGPEPVMGTRSNASSLTEVQKRAREGKKVYKHTAENWAFTLYMHCKPQQAGKAALEELIGRHAHNPVDSAVSFQGKSMDSQDVLQLLLDYTEIPDRKSRARPGGKLTRSENSWLAVLDDEFTEDSFNLLFHLRERERSNTVRNAARANSDLPQIKAAWHPNFEIDPDLLNRLVGKYLLYRIYYTKEELEGRLDESDGDWGWLGNQRIQVVPLTLREESGGLKWEDFFPDPTEILYHSIAFIAKQHDEFELYGIDKEDFARGKFLGKLNPFKNGRSKGAIFARDRQTPWYEAYKFYLKSVREPEYRQLLNRVNELADIFRDHKKLQKEKQLLFSNDGLIFRRVSDLLEESECDIVHWLYSPRGFEPDDLRSKDAVKKIGYSNIFRGVKLTSR